MVTKSKLTLKEFLKLPEGDVSLEFVDGEVLEKAAPQTQHAILTDEVITQLKARAESAGYKVLAEIRLVFGDPSRAYVPDVGIARQDAIGVDRRGR